MSLARYFRIRGLVGKNLVLSLGYVNSIRSATKFPLFFNENETLLWKNSYKRIIQSIAYH